jgi:hypothetical protein
MGTLLPIELADTSAAVAGSMARLVKIGALAECLRRAEPAEVPVAVGDARRDRVAFRSGERTQRQIGVSWAGPRQPPPPAGTPSLPPRELGGHAVSPVGASWAGTPPLPPGEVDATAADTVEAVRDPEPVSRRDTAVLVRIVVEGVYGRISCVSSVPSVSYHR